MKVWQEDEIYIVELRGQQIWVDPNFKFTRYETGHKILDVSLPKEDAEKVFQAVDDFIKDNKTEETYYDVRDEQGLFGYGY